VNHALVVGSDERIRQDVGGIFFHARWLAGHRTDLARRLLDRLTALDDLEERARIALES
jgi:hypothetical protein